MDFEIVTYGNVRLLASVLESIALMMGNPASGYIGMMATAVGIGFIVALVAYAVAPRKLAGWYWLGSVAAVTLILVLPKARVQVIDRLPGCGIGGNCVTVVENVPAGLALVASVTSRIGDRLTELFEVNFANFAPPGEPVDQLSYRGNGLMFGHKVLRETSHVTFPDLGFHHDVVTYLDHCAGQDLADRTVSVDDLRTSKDIWNTLRAGGVGGNPAVFVAVSSGAVVSCRKLQEDLGERMGAQEQAALVRLGYRLNSNAPNPPANDVAAADAASGQAMQAYLRTRLGQAGQDAAALVRQNGFVNAMKAVQTMRSQRTEDPSAALLGQSAAQARVSTNSAWITGAKVAEEAMPLIRNGIEAILYAAFPIIVLMTLVVSGKTAMKLGTSYAAVLLWIQLWPPLYAVLNFMATEASARHIAASGGLTNGAIGLTLLTSESIYEDVISDMAVVGYLVTFIPVIAWSLVKGMESLAGGAIAGAAAYTAGAREAGALASTGNHSLGNVSHDQVNLAPSYRAANFSTFENGYMSRTDDMSSRNLDTWQAKESNTGINASAVHQMASSKSQAASEQIGIGNRESIAAENALTSAFNSARSFVSQHSDSYTAATSDGKSLASAIGHSTRIRDAFGFSGDTSHNTAAGQKATKGHKSTNTKTDTSKAGLKQSASAAGAIDAGGTNFGLSNSADLAAEKAFAKGEAFEAGGSSESGAGTAASWKADGSSAEAADKTRSVLDTLMHSETFTKAVADGDTLALSIQRSFNESEAWRQSSESHLAEGRALQSQASYMESHAESIATSYNNYGARKIQESGGTDSFIEALSHDPQTAARMMSDATGYFRRSADDLQQSLQTERLNDHVVADIRGSAFSGAPTPNRILEGSGPGGARLQADSNGRPSGGSPQAAMGGSGGTGRGAGGRRGAGSGPGAVNGPAAIQTELDARSSDVHKQASEIARKADATRNEANLEILKGRVDTSQGQIDASNPPSKEGS